MNRRSFLMAMGMTPLPSALSRDATPAAHPAPGGSEPPDGTAGRAARPNILILLADDMGYSDPGYMGGDADTPNLDKLAADGVVFTDFYNNAKCAPTRASLMSGLYNWRVKADHAAGNNVRGAVNMGELFGDHGYETFLIDKWHIRPKPWDLGMDWAFGSLLAPAYFDPGKIRLGTDRKGQYDIATDRIMPTDYLNGEDWYLTTEDTCQAMDFLENKWSRKTPFFMYYAPHNPHWPLQAPREDIHKYYEGDSNPLGPGSTFHQGSDVARQRRFKKMKAHGIISGSAKLSPAEKTWDSLSRVEKMWYCKAFAIHTAMVHRMDKEIGRLLEYLKQINQFDNTIIVFLSDNGASREGNQDSSPSKNELARLGSHDFDGRIDRIGAEVMNTPMRGAKSTVWEGGVSTSMVFHWPGGIGRPGRISRQVGHAVDIFPTLLDITAIEYPETYRDRDVHPCDGISLRKHIENGEHIPQILCWHYEGRIAVRAGRWKAVTRLKNKREPDTRQPWQLYDMSKDRMENENLADSHPEIVKRLDTVWIGWWRDVNK